ncbi:DUF2865 domain-containing protein [Faunimonas sp. B44]|uniref:DUF2865 domain-containing protein n=1 Tax=Faunimonas sp. B44 TaxID=3461493 RepID=UPI004043ACDE
MRKSHVFATAFAGLVLALGGQAEASNCFALESQEMRIMAGGVTAGEAGRLSMIRDRLVAEGCRRPTRSQATAAVAPRQAIERQAAARKSAPAPRRTAEEVIREPGRTLARSGTFRTMCVRTCDGYYFPISFSTSRDRFAADADACSARCPGAQLYAYDAGRDEAEDMVSLRGEPYSRLPAAFRYRQQLVESCTCGPAAAPMSTAYLSLDAAPAEPAFALLPRSRPGQREGEVIQASFASPAVDAVEQSGASEAAAAAREIRLVGPAPWGQSNLDKLMLRPIGPYAETKPVEEAEFVTSLASPTE